MKLFIFRIIVRIIKFFHLERRVPQLRQMDYRCLKPHRLYYHYGRILLSYGNPKRHYFNYKVMQGEQSYVTSDKDEAMNAQRNGALVDELHHNLPCHLCDIKREGLPCCVCSMNVYFKIVDEFKQHGCQ